MNALFYLISTLATLSLAAPLVTERNPQSSGAGGYSGCVDGHDAEEGGCVSVNMKTSSPLKKYQKLIK
jgi:hypothetical protein